MLLAIAWRNLWRNWRRTLITLSAVAIGLAMIIVSFGFVRAFNDALVEGLTGSYLGHIQIHQQGYRSRNGSSRSVSNAGRVLAAVRSTEGVEAAAGRIYGAAHASFVRGSDDEVRAGGGEEVDAPVVVALGVDPQQERAVTDLADRVTEGRWIEGATDVVVGANLARRAGVLPGDAFVPTAVDALGITRGPWAVGENVPRVVGILRSGIDAIDDRTVLVSRDYLERLLRMDDEVHEIAIRAQDPEQLAPVVEAIRRAVAEARSGGIGSERFSMTSPLSQMGFQESSTAAEEDGDVALSTHAVRLVGVVVDPDAEERSTLPRLLSGRFVVRSEDIVLTDLAAEALGASIGDRLELAVPVDCGDDVPDQECPPSGESFIVAGVISADRELLDGNFGLVMASVIDGNIAALSPGVVSELPVETSEAFRELIGELRGERTSTDEVLRWQELVPEVQEALVMMEVMPLTLLFVLFIAVGLGITNTLLMSTFERTHELGLMKALGMRPSKVVALILAESLELALLGTVIGLAIGLGLVGYWAVYGMDMSSLMSGGQSTSSFGVTLDAVLWPRIVVADVLEAGVGVAVLTTLSGLWPAIKAARLQPVDAMRDE